MDTMLFALTFVSALGCGVTAGVFFAFSSFIMKGLGRLPAAQGIAAMQAINVAAVSPAFMLVLFGTGVACSALVVWSVILWGEPFAVYLLIGGSLYVIGVTLLTIGYHVPGNEALATVDPHDEGAEHHWSRYLSDWTRWNHARTATALAASTMHIVALCV